MLATGEFKVDLEPIDTHATGTDGISLGRMSIAKTFTGDLVARSQGEMLTAITAVKGSAGYVAIEQVSGDLDGHSGSFVLQHFGTMDQGKDRLILEVVPDSGAGGLTGIAGKMVIKIDGDTHRYEFDFDLP